MDKDAYKFGEKFGYNIHFSASWGEEFSSSAISRELSTIFSDHVATNSNPKCSQCIQDKKLLSPTFDGHKARMELKKLTLTIRYGNY